MEFGHVEGRLEEPGSREASRALLGPLSMPCRVADGALVTRELATTLNVDDIMLF